MATQHIHTADATIEVEFNGVGLIKLTMIERTIPAESVTTLLDSGEVAQLVTMLRQIYETPMEELDVIAPPDPR